MSVIQGVLFIKKNIYLFRADLVVSGGESAVQKVDGVGHTY